MAKLTFEKYRLNEKNILPKLLQGTSFDVVQGKRLDISPDVSSCFPHLLDYYVQKIAPLDGKKTVAQPLRVGVVLSGGQAPGGHNVIAGLFDALFDHHRESVLIGFLGGLKGVLTDSSRQILQADIDAVRNCGGFQLLGSGRTKIDSEKEIQKAIETIVSHKLDGLVIVGGDDSNTAAVHLSEALAAHGERTAVIGVPKTIDGDLRSEEIPISFGFDTACKVYSQIIGNTAKDMISSGKYYHFIRLMGRQASHITLECALQTKPNLALISEEISDKERTLQSVVTEIADLVEERYAQNLCFGLILVPEGLVDHMVDIKRLILELNELLAPNHPLAASIQETTSPSSRLDLVVKNISDDARKALLLFPRHIAEELVYERDPHGNIQLSRIETERLLAQLTSLEIQARSRKRGKTIPFATQTNFLGYEGRSAYPSYFDCHYGYALGKLSALLVEKGLTGHMAALQNLGENVEHWVPVAVPLVSLLHFERRLGEEKAVIRKSPVDLHGPLFRLFAENRDKWRHSFDYAYPGPIQFWGPDDVVQGCCSSIAEM